MVLTLMERERAHYCVQWRLRDQSCGSGLLSIASVMDLSSCRGLSLAIALDRSQ